MEITFAATEEQQLLRETARKWLADRSDSERVRELMMADTGWDADEWQETVAMGWAALPIPEELGGAGYGWAEVGVIAEEAGAALWCAPFLSSAVLATATLLDARGEVADGVLARLAAGEATATLAHRGGEDLTWDGSTLSGTAPFVLDGDTADVLLVPASGPEGDVLVAVERGDGVTSTPLPVLDLTRRQADVALDGAAGSVVATGDAASSAVDRGVTVAAVVLANESLGGAAKVLRDSVEYGKSRIQFGRAVGSYQALKHRMADTLKRVEAARSAAHHAVRVLDGEDEAELAVAAPVAVTFVGSTYEQAAGDNIQNHGGIGFTWEHDAHLYFKRAKSSTLLFGDATSWRSRLGDAIGV